MDVNSLKIKSISKPQTVTRYSELTLKCEYQLENEDRLYGLKWFLEGSEILRYMPGLEPPLRYNPTNPSGLVIDDRRSNGSVIHFHQIDLTAAGVWKCLVMTEAPYFESMEAFTHLKVVGNLFT